MAESSPRPHPIRMLVFGLKWPPETFMQRLLSGLAARGVEITLARPQRPRDRAFEASGFAWLPQPGTAGPRLWRRLALAGAQASAGLRSPAGLARARRLAGRGPGRHKQLGVLSAMAGRGWDLVYFPWNATAIELRSVLDLGIPAVVSCRGSQLKVGPHNPTRGQLREGFQETFRRAAAVHCVSEDLRHEALQYGLDPERAWIIRPAVDTADFRPPEVRPACPEGAPLALVTTGSLIWRKGLEFAIASLAGLRDRGIPARLTIIGEGPERQRLRYTAEDLGVAAAVELAGNLPPDQVRDRLRAADVFLLSSVCEGISNAVLEAMACGLPVVTTDCGGMGEAVTDGVEGFVVPVRDVGRMTDALERLGRDPGLRRQLGQAARDRTVRDFDLSGQIDQWMTLIEHVLGEGRR